MTINEMKPIEGIDPGSKSSIALSKFTLLLKELRKRDLPDAIALQINSIIAIAEQLYGNDPRFRSRLGKLKNQIIRLLEKELKIVPRNYYRTLWMAVGIGAFGLPLGVALGASFGNMGFIGMGLPFGIAIGLALGTGMDKKAFEEGRQLNVDLT